MLMIDYDEIITSHTIIFQFATNGTEHAYLQLSPLNLEVMCC
jgi:hypothetical protein